MIKHNCVFKDMPFEYSEGKKEVYLNCNNVYISKLTDQRVGMHVMDYRDGKLVIDGSFRQVFDLEDFELYVQFGDKRQVLTNTDRYSLTKYFGISAYKKFTFHLELELDPKSLSRRLHSLQDTRIQLFRSSFHSCTIGLSLQSSQRTPTGDSTSMLPILTTQAQL